MSGRSAIFVPPSECAQLQNQLPQLSGNVCLTSYAFHRGEPLWQASYRMILGF